MSKRIAALLIVLPLGSALLASEEPGRSASSEARIRQPAALAFSRDGAWLFAANRRSGSLSIVEVASSKVIAEVDLGRALADIAALPDGRQLVAVDPQASSLLLLAHENGQIQVVERLAVSADPVSVLVNTDGRSLVLASRWTRRLTFVGVAQTDKSPALRVVRTLDLPFSPLKLAWVRGGTKLIAADAFGGKIAVVNPKRHELESVRTLPAHNIRGLAESPDGKSLVVVHQALNGLARTSFEDVHWGSLLKNHVRTLWLDSVLTPGSDSDLLSRGHLFDLGSVGNAAGDPAALAFDARGSVIVALAGVNAVAVSPGLARPFRRTEVGHRPSAVAPAPDGKVVYVANMGDDAIAVVAIATGKPLATISLGPRPELSTADRGERLFYDAKLSHDGWMSCQSCHTDGHANGQLTDTLGDGSFGAPKRVPSLLGVGATGPWSWLGDVDRLEAQVRKSIEMTMRGRTPSDAQVEDLTAYLRSLSPPTVPAPPETTAAQERGRVLFHEQKCARCHAAPEYTSTAQYDVGLTDEVGNGKFNPPSLRGVGLREPLLHDGRATDLGEVFRKYRHPNETTLSEQQVADLVAFLRTL